MRRVDEADAAGLSLQIHQVDHQGRLGPGGAARTGLVLDVGGLAEARSSPTRERVPKYMSIPMSRAEDGPEDHGQGAEDGDHLLEELDPLPNPRLLGDGHEGEHALPP